MSKCAIGQEEQLRNLKNEQVSKLAIFEINKQANVREQSQ